MEKNFSFLYIFIKIDGYRVKLPVTDILFLKARDKYVEVVTVNKTYIIRASLGKVEAGLFPELFCRVHRSYIVNLYHVREVYKDYLIVDKENIPFHPDYFTGLDQKLPTLN